MMNRRPMHAIPANLASVIHPSILQFDPTKAEEISRTIYVGNIASNVVEQQLMDFFSACGPVAYVKMAGDGLQPTRFAFVEFADMPTAQAALQMNGMMLADRPLKVNHSKNAINKPPRPAIPPPVMVQVPTLAAMASLPSSADPMAVRVQSGYPTPGTGLAWPVLGNVNPAPSEADSALTRRLRELQAQVDAKYGPRLAAAAATIVFVNTLGTIISIYILLCFWWYANSRYVETRFLLTLVSGLLMIAYVDHSTDPHAEYAFSLVCCLMSLIFLASPLSQIGNVIRLQDASVLLPSVALLAFFNNVLWSVYGHIHNDAFMLFPNAIGAALCALQLGLIAYYGRAAANLPLSTTSKPSPEYKDGVEDVPMAEITV
ncbi:hypothetical protein IW146_003228 [Coemansia sp. RSA 922]|nr:hypothetical protein IW146_003228 [Coemansia sp. RSA 922]